MSNWLKKLLSSKQTAPGDNANDRSKKQPTQVALDEESVVYKEQGDAYLRKGNLEDAKACYRRAIALNPAYAKAYSNLGLVLKNLGLYGDAEQYLNTALSIDPKIANAHYLLGTIFQLQDRLEEAVSHFQNALAITPDFENVYCDLCYALFQQGKITDAMHAITQGISINYAQPDFHYYRGNLHKHTGEFDKAVTDYKTALSIQPAYAEVHYNLGIALHELGRLDEAEASYRRTLEIKPDFADAHSNLIFTLDLMIGKNASFLQEERVRWDTAHAAHLHQRQTHPNISEPERRIRIGYVSADFKDHSAPRAFGGMLTHYDHSQFDVFAYSNFNGKDDKFTELFRQNVTIWRNIASLSDDTVAKMIREDRIDILVDLSGHTSGNRLLVFARKPAPIQITAWGYAASTGMRAMDVFFADQVIVPPKEQRYFIEEVRYLPCAVGAFFTEQFPDVTELPALSGDTITFGSFNRLAKISDEVYRTWAQVLLAIPRSRLILKTGELNAASVREQVIAHFTKAGVASDRITLQGKTSWYEHMLAYRQIDIALDPFPQGGGVTALEGLMMGVPIINLLGSTVSGRLSASIVTTLGLSDWTAKTREQYIELAIQKAANLQSLTLFRQQLRSIFTSSAIGDQVAYVQAAEREYRQLWREWCNAHSSQSSPE